MPCAVEPEGGDRDVVRLLRFRGVEPGREPQQVLAAGHLSGSRAQHPLGVGEERLQGAQGGVPELVHLAAVLVSAGVAEPVAQPLPVRDVPSTTALHPSLGQSVGERPDARRVPVDPGEQRGQVRPHTGQVPGDARGAEGDVLGDRLHVVEQQFLEPLVLGTVEVVTGEHLAQVGVEVPYGLGEFGELHEERADPLQRLLRIRAPGVATMAAISPRPRSTRVSSSLLTSRAASAPASTSSAPRCTRSPSLDSW